jgi:hypothetical protein
VLFDADGNVVGSHYAFAGPTRPAWQTLSGSLVVGARSVPPVTVDPTAIPWLILQAVSTEGPGILEHTTYIQRVNTAGGLAPAALPTSAGEVARVPYTTEYYFYRAANWLAAKRRVMVSKAWPARPGWRPGFSPCPGRFRPARL